MNVEILILKTESNILIFQIRNVSLLMQSDHLSIAKDFVEWQRSTTTCFTRRKLAVVDVYNHNEE